MTHFIVFFRIPALILGGVGTLFKVIPDGGEQTNIDDITYTSIKYITTSNYSDPINIAYGLLITVFRDTDGNVGVQLFFNGHTLIGRGHTKTGGWGAMKQITLT